MRENTKDYRAIFLSDTPMIDLRAPCEFAKGSFPNTVGLPLMSDIERQKIGTCYKRDGQEAAIKLGHQLVKGELKKERIAGWKKFIQVHQEDGFLFCFRVHRMCYAVAPSLYTVQWFLHPILCFHRQW